MKYKALICDVDWTIVQNDLHAVPSDRVTTLLKKAKKYLHVGLATARSLKFSQHLFDHLESTGPSIVLGGCQIVDTLSKKVLVEYSLDKDIFWKVAKILEKQKRKFIIDEPQEKVPYSKKYKPQKPLSIYVPTLTNALSDEIKTTLEHIPSIAITKGTDWGNNMFCLNITHLSSTKQHAIFTVAELLGIETHEIIGVGDSYNDFPLLMACGLKVAMGNAVPELKAIADYIAPSVEEDGVADVIEKFILNN